MKKIIATIYILFFAFSQNYRGEMYITVRVEIPVNLTNQQKSILKEFENEGGTSKAHSPKSQSFFKKLKEVWEELT